MDTISRLYCKITELEDNIASNMEDWTLDTIEDLQEELEIVTTKLRHLENDKRRQKNKDNGVIFRDF